jgi:hypothetical protein
VGSAAGLVDADQGVGTGVHGCGGTPSCATVDGRRLGITQCV